MDILPDERAENPDQSTCEKDRRVRKIRQLLGVLTVCFIVLTQIFLYTTPINDAVITPNGFLLSLLGLGVFVLSQRISIPQRAVRFRWLDPASTGVRVTAAAVFAVLTTVAMVSFQRYGRVNYMPVLSLWVISGALYLSSFPLPRPDFRGVPAWVKAHRGELLALLFIVLAAAILRFYRLGGIPRVINGDEGMIGLVAQSTTKGDIANPFSLYNNMGGLYLQVLNLFITLLGPSAYSIRLPSAIGGVLSVIVTYGLCGKYFSVRVALLTAAMIAISHTHISFSRTLTGYIQDTWLIPLEVLLLLNGLEKRQSWQAALAGMLLAAHFSYYLTAPPMTAILIGYLILCLVFHRRWLKSVLPQVAAFGGGLIILLLPALYRYLAVPMDLIARLNMEGTFQSGWLEMTVAQSGQSAVQVLLSRVTHAFLSLIYYPSLDFYGSRIPMLSMITSVLFLIGLATAAMKIKQRPTLLVLTVLVGFVLMIGLFAIPPSADSYRVVVVLPLAMILAGVGIDAILDLFGLGWRKSRAAYAAASGILMVLLFFTNAQIYFGDFYGRCQFGGDMMSRFASYLGSYVRQYDRSTPVFLLSDDLYFYGSHPSVDFLSGSHPITNIQDPVDTQSFASEEVIIATPHRVEELQEWVDAHPGGKVQYLYDCNYTILLGYQVP